MTPGGIVVNPACSQFDSPGDDNYSKVEEYACFTNQGGKPVDMTGWVVKDEAGWTYTFPAFTLDLGTSVRVRTDCGTDTKQDLHWCKGGASAIWNNSGDIVLLLDAAGNPVARYSY